MGREQIERVVLDSGLWEGPGSKSTHGFVLSPSVYEVTEDRRSELESIAAALHDCLSGLGRIAAIACSPQLNKGVTWGMLARVFRVGIPGTYREIQLLNPSRVPSICKVDFMEAADGHLYIAEIDGHNKHGLGYSALAARIRKLVAPEARTFPGVGVAIAQEVRRLEHEADGLILLYADQERFYLPEFRILQEELESCGIAMAIVAESDFVSSEHDKQLLLDLPFLFRSAWGKVLAQCYQDGRVDFLIPPKPFLGSKAILALLRNDEENQELEAILLSQIPATSLSILRGHIPPTYLVHKRRRQRYWEELYAGGQFVLKETVSSGMKGVVFPEDPKFERSFGEACGSYYRFVLQEEVENRSHRFQFFTDGEEVEEDEWFIRVTVHFAVRRVADIIVTARRDKRVHGALDSLQMGAVIV